MDQEHEILNELVSLCEELDYWRKRLIREERSGKKNYNLQWLRNKVRSQYEMVEHHKILLSQYREFGENYMPETTEELYQELTAKQQQASRIANFLLDKFLRQGKTLLMLATETGLSTYKIRRFFNPIADDDDQPTVAEFFMLAKALHISAAMLDRWLNFDETEEN